MKITSSSAANVARHRAVLWTIIALDGLLVTTALHAADAASPKSRSVAETAAVNLLLNPDFAGRRYRPLRVCSEPALAPDEGPDGHEAPCPLRPRISGLNRSVQTGDIGNRCSETWVTGFHVFDRPRRSTVATCSAMKNTLQTPSVSVGRRATG